MVDTIDRRVVIKAIEKMKDSSGKGDIAGFYNTIIDNVIDKLKNLPSVQQEIVHCKDCKYHTFTDDRAFGFPVRRCELTGFEDLDEDDFCNRGENREDDIHTEHSRSSKDDWDCLMHNAREKLHEQLKIKADGD